MSKVKTEQERQELMAALGLEGPTKAASTTTQGIKLAPDGVDPRTMPVKDIVFDPRLVEQFPSLAPRDRKAAADHMFGLYKGKRGEERNRVLWAEIGKWLVKVERERKSGVPHVKEEVKRGKQERDLLALMREMGIGSVDDLQALLGSENNNAEEA